MSRLKGAPPAYSRAPNFSEFLGPQIYTLATDNTIVFDKNMGLLKQFTVILMYFVQFI